MQMSLVFVCVCNKKKSPKQPQKHEFYRSGILDFTPHFLQSHYTGEPSAAAWGGGKILVWHMTLFTYMWHVTGLCLGVSQSVRGQINSVSWHQHVWIRAGLSLQHAGEWVHRSNRKSTPHASNLSPTHDEQRQKKAPCWLSVSDDSSDLWHVWLQHKQI